MDIVWVLCWDICLMQLEIKQSFERKKCTTGSIRQDKSYCSRYDVSSLLIQIKFFLDSGIQYEEAPYHLIKEKYKDEKKNL
jgi:hypothetical protein